MKRFAPVLLVACLGGCASFKPVVRTADDLAQEACALFFGDKQGIDIEAAAKAYCATRQAWAPFINPILAAEKQGGALALKAREGK